MGGLETPGWCWSGWWHHLHASPQEMRPQLLGFRQGMQLTPADTSISSFLLVFKRRHHNIHPKGCNCLWTWHVPSHPGEAGAQEGRSSALQLVLERRRAQDKGRDPDSKAWNSHGRKTPPDSSCPGRWCFPGHWYHLPGTRRWHRKPPHLRPLAPYAAVWLLTWESSTAPSVQPGTGILPEPFGLSRACWRCFIGSSNPSRALLAVAAGTQIFPRESTEHPNPKPKRQDPDRTRLTHTVVLTRG